MTDDSKAGFPPTRPVEMGPLRTMANPADPSGSRPPMGTGPEPRGDPRPGAVQRGTAVIAVLSVACILAHLALRFGTHAAPGFYNAPLLMTLALGGAPLVYGLLIKVMRREFGSDLLGGISIVTSLFLGQYLAGSIIVLMLSGGEAL